jgi:polysaccharide pyruvyl transferase WcaK-like protein
MIPVLRNLSRHSDQATGHAVAVIGNYGNSNLGDEATLAAIIEQVRRRRPNPKIIALSVDPDDTRVRHGVTARAAWGRGRKPRPAEAPAPRPSRRSIWLRNALRPFASIARGPFDLLVWLGAAADELIFPLACRAAMSGVDLLIVGGSGQISDQFSGPWNFPYRLLVWVLAAKLAGAKVGFLCVGAGSVTASLSRTFLKAALSLADHRSLRDERSRRIVDELGVRRPSVVAADVVFDLEGATAPAVVRKPMDPPRVIGLNVFPYHAPFYWPNADPAIYRAYLDSTAEFVGWLGRHRYVVHLFPTQLRADLRVIGDLTATLEAKGIRLPATHLLHAQVTGVESLAATVVAVDLVVATRFHALVMALRAGTPVLALSSQPKTDDLMADMGLSAYRVSIDHLDLSSLTARFTSLTQNAASVREQIKTRVRQLRREVDECLDGLLGVPRSDADTGPIPTPVPAPRADTRFLNRPPERPR